MVDSSKYNAEQRARAARLRTFGQQIKLMAGMRDAVCYMHTHPNGQKFLIFGYRGTASWKDILPDLQLALNRRNIERLEQARSWTRRVRARFASIPNSRLFFTGHSLGG